jgi:sigma-B regulation protein RsbU (phosphoserine phosphatase)
MDEGVITRIRTSLTAKRDLLRQWSQAAPPQKAQDVLGPAGKPAFERHLTVLDEALIRSDDHTLGVCTECHEPVEASLIQMDYTASVCLDHLSGAERRSLEAELELAGAVQRSLLPQRPPTFPGVEIAAFSRPAQIVGGDYFDFFPFAGGRQGLVISDVVGHGLSSSLIMASLQTMLRTLAQEHASPADLVARINRLCLHNIQFTTFITLFLAAFDPVARELTYCNAGHNPPLLLRRSSTEWLRPTGPAIGLTEDSTFSDHAVSLAPGESLFLYTDGATETPNPHGDLFGAPRLEALLRGNAAAQPQDLLQAVRGGLEAFAGEAPPSDDLTMVALRVVA